MLYGVEAQINIAGLVAPPVSPYSPQGVHFEGLNTALGTYLHRGSLAAIDNGNFSFSFWIKGLDDVINDTCYLWSVAPNAQDVTYCNITTISLQNYLFFEFSDDTLFYWATIGPLTGSGWHHFLCSAEMNHAAGAKLLTVYYDDVLQTPSSVHDPSISFIPLYNGREFVTPDKDGNRGFVGDMADVWIAPGISLIDETVGTISDATRRQFTDFTTASGCIPINPTTFPSSAILFTGNAASFVTNQGTGGAFNQVGIITDAATNPP